MRQPGLILEIACTDADFQRFRELIYQQVGINLHEGKKELVKARLSKRIREICLASFKEYYEYIKSGQNQDEVIAMVNAISTNVTSFFRESDHFTFLKETLIPHLTLRKNRKYNNQLRLWSAGCSTGEEPYSIAMTVLDALPDRTCWDIKILATDVSTQVLNKAQTGLYEKDRITGIPPNMLRTYFQRGNGQWQGYFRVKDTLQNIITFRYLNLMKPFPFNRPFDVIFCRNVMIYFDRSTQETLVNKYYQHLDEDGHLFVGHSESLAGVKHSFNYVKPTIYSK
ncbi:MAG: protein-glutamate O-methyltransferase [Deltaproteobacteria bacterium]|nr:protein-glutamate O-methyltransferase [Deltaproteobacteria bacterium]